MLDAQATALGQSLRAAAAGGEWPTDARVREIGESPLLFARYAPVATLMPAIGRLAAKAEALLGRRDGVEVGIALTLYRRRHGSYPTSLDALVPTMLPSVPVDRITGDAVRYRLIDGAPVAYSVGIDRDDDGGRPATYRPGFSPDSQYAAQWFPGDYRRLQNPIPDGDWLLFDARPAGRQEAP